MIWNKLALGEEQLGHVRDPCHILADRRIGDLESGFLRMEGDADADGLIVLGENFPTEQRRHEGCNPLLTVDEDALARPTGCRL